MIRRVSSVSQSADVSQKSDGILNCALGETVNVEARQRVCGVFPILLLCMPVCAQFTDVIENARQRDREGIGILSGQPDSRRPDGKIPSAEYHPDFADDEKGVVFRPAAHASVISKGVLAHKPPKAARREFDRGMRARRKQISTEATHHFTEAVRLDPNYLEAHAELGELLLRNGEAYQALKCFERALSIDGSFSSLHANEALALIKLKRPEEAEAAARRAVLLAPGSEPTHYALGVALLNQGRATRETAEHLAVAAGRFPDVREGLAWVQEHLSSSPVAQH